VRAVREEDARWTVNAAGHYLELSDSYRDSLREVDEE
jgi:hypothetical protein